MTHDFKCLSRECRDAKWEAERLLAAAAPKMKPRSDPQAAADLGAAWSRSQERAVHPKSIPGALELARRRHNPTRSEQAWAAGGAPTPPERPPLQEFALQVPTVVRRRLEEDIKRGRIGNPSTTLDQVAEKAVLHILETGIRAYLDVEHAGMEQVWANLERERDKARAAGGDLGTMAEFYWLALPAPAQQHIRDLAIGVQDPPDAGPLPFRVAQEIAGVAIDAYLDLDEELASKEAPEDVGNSVTDLDYLRDEEAIGE